MSFEHLLDCNQTQSRYQATRNCQSRDWRQDLNKKELCWYSRISRWNDVRKGSPGSHGCPFSVTREQTPWWRGWASIMQTTVSWLTGWWCWEGRVWGKDLVLVGQEGREAKGLWVASDEWYFGSGFNVQVLPLPGLGHFQSVLPTPKIMNFTTNPIT